MIKKLLAWGFKAAGWKVDGKKPDLKKYVVIVAPHTSNWDFFVGWSARNVIGFYPNFLAKKELFNIPGVGLFLKFIGGVPVDRKKKTNLVDQVVELYQAKDAFIMTITPEGTRSYSPNWKTGFYRIAEKAQVPIVKIGFDYATKTVFVDKPYYTKGNMEEEIEEMKDYFRAFKGKNPEDGVR
jgi:1-acyl-sn-glycerol-3-phosphate acyltransferase